MRRALYLAIHLLGFLCNLIVTLTACYLLAA